jgi:hypothetical protein
MATDQHRRIRPIATRYGGILFRSRLEARWALFFDRLHIPWEYEPQGFDIGDGQAYLPDFILGLGDLVYAEVKPSVWADEDGVARWRKFMGLQKPGTRGVLLVSMTGRWGQMFTLYRPPGEPAVSAMWLCCPDGYHFDLKEPGLLEPCAQCGGGTRCSSCGGSGLHKGGPVICYCCDPPGSGRVASSHPLPPWDDDRRIGDAYSAALSARFGGPVSSG